MKETEKAYLAGVIDSDGSIFVFHAKTRDVYNIRLDICQANIKDLEKLRKIWGGRIQKGKTSSHLIWDSQNALYVLQEVFPFSKFKDEQISIGMMFLDSFSTGRGNKVGLEIQKKRKWCYRRLKELKRRKYSNQE